MFASGSDTVGMDEASRRALRPALERLGRASAENRRRVAAAIAAHKRLLDVVATTIREMTPSASGYVRGGAPSRGVTSPFAALAVSFDRAL